MTFLRLIYVLSFTACIWADEASVQDQLNSMRVAKTVGQVWPAPQNIDRKDTVLYMNPISFTFQYDDSLCEVISSAFTRYYQLIFRPTSSKPGISPQFNDVNFFPTANKSLGGSLRGELQSLQVQLTAECEQWPYLNMDEQYQLKIDTEDYPLEAKLIAVSPWGVLRGLETFSQLIYQDYTTGLYLINSTFILDFPRFSHRGILLDTARHYVPIHIIKENLDAMAYNKFNVFHWHIVDDQSFPYQSIRYPNMTEYGAYDPLHHIYTVSEIKDIIDYARLRGIRVVAEFDTPGHTLSWGASINNLLTECYNTTTNETNGKYGPIDPSLPSTYTFLTDFFTEVSFVFPEPYLHFGGDEVDFSCWESNPLITNFMKQMNITTYRQLESYYMTNLLDSVTELGFSPLVWQEVFDNNVELDNSTVVEVWKSAEMLEMFEVTKAGYRAILASCWYLDYIYHMPDWQQFYICEPQDFNATQQQLDLVIGGEACLWGEYVDGSNLIARLWPRASAAGERLWSNKSMTDVNAAAPRYEELRCRMMSRGIHAEPQNGPGFCDSDYLL
ncbi:hypothetical protein CHUAL_005444 [Chamberlinius hualienensis]